MLTAVKRESAITDKSNATENVATIYMGLSFVKTVMAIKSRTHSATVAVRTISPVALVRMKKYNKAVIEMSKQAIASAMFSIGL